MKTDSEPVVEHVVKKKPSSSTSKKWFDETTFEFKTESKEDLGSDSCDLGFKWVRIPLLNKKNMKCFFLLIQTMVTKTSESFENFKNGNPTTNVYCEHFKASVMDYICNGMSCFLIYSF